MAGTVVIVGRNDGAAAGSEYKAVFRALARSVERVPKRDRLLLGLAAALMLVVGITTNLPALLVGSLVDQFLQQEGADIATAVPYLGAILALIVVRELSQVGRRYAAERAATALERQLRVDVTSSVLHAEQELFSDTQSGSLYGRMSRGVEGGARIVKLAFLDFLPSSFIAAVAVVLVWTRDWRLGVLVSVFLPVLAFIVARQLRSQRGVRISLLRRKEAVDGTIVELLRDLDSVKAMDAVGFEVNRVKKVATDLQTIELRHHVAMAWYDALKFGVEGVTHVSVLAVAVSLAAMGVLSVGEILSVSLLFIGVLAPVRELHRILDEGHESSLQAEDLHTMLEVPRDLSFQSRPTGDGRARDSASVICERVSVRYSGSQEPAVQHVDLRVSEGEFVGICGPAGCGKSTLVKAILRLIPLAGGEISLLGDPLDAFDRTRLARVVAYVPQSSFLVTGTVRENIAYGLPAADLDDVVQATVEAQLHEEVMRLPRGYDTRVGEAGLRLSGGQRQRVALARVFLRRPRIVVLDEATSSLDNLNEVSVQAALEAAEFTMLAIAHRLSTLRNAHKIIVMDHGSVVEHGTYEDLLERGGLFSALEAAGRLK